MLCRCQESGINVWNYPRESPPGRNLWADSYYALQHSELLQQCNLCREEAVSISFLLPPHFFNWIPLAGSTNFHDFLLGLFPTPSLFPICTSRPLYEKNSPCQQSQALQKWLPEWSSFLIPSGRLGEVTWGSPLCCQALSCDFIPPAHIQVLNSFFYHFKEKIALEKKKKKSVFCPCPSPREEEQEQTSSSSLAGLGVSCWSGMIPCVVPPWFLGTAELRRHKHSRWDGPVPAGCWWCCASRGESISPGVWQLAAKSSWIFMQKQSKIGIPGRDWVRLLLKVDWNALGSDSRYKIWTQREAEKRPEGGPCSDRRSLLESVQISKDHDHQGVWWALRELNGSCVAQRAKRTLGEHRKRIQPQTITLLVISFHSGAAARLFCRERLRGRGGLGEQMDYNIAFPGNRNKSLVLGTDFGIAFLKFRLLGDTQSKWQIFSSDLW